MMEFFEFIIYTIKESCGLLLKLPFTNDFTFGDALIALAILSVLITSLVTSIRTANMQHEAGMASSSERLSDVGKGD